MRFRRLKLPRAPAVKPEQLALWVPKTEIGRAVKEGRIKSIDEIFARGKPIMETEIVDTLLPNLKYELVGLTSTQRMTDSGRKQKFRAVVAVGDESGYVGAGFGKAEEVRPALEIAIANAKARIIKVNLGCGAWECGCGGAHSLPARVRGHYGGVRITIKPAPRGTGLVGASVVRTVLELGGVKDAWTKAEGRTKNVLNTTLAVIDALDSLNRLRIK